MQDITYPQFLNLVSKAYGPFSYVYAGEPYICDPVVYKAMHWPNGIPLAFHDQNLIIPVKAQWRAEGLGYV